MKKPRENGVIVMAILGLLAGAQVVQAVNQPQPKEPDYIKGEKLSQRYPEGQNDNYCALGPIGAIGNVWGDKKDEKGMTDKTRTIQIRSVLKGAPADGILQAGDVVIGILSPTPDGKITKDRRFDSDVRTALSWAITEAEKRENGCKLVLNVWRQGMGTMPVTLTIPVMGTYSKTAPWDCDKSKAIIENMCSYILKEGFFKQEDEGSAVAGGGIPGKLEALGLLATGEQKYVPLVKDYARKVADAWKDKTFSSSWFASYDLLLLTEYYLATRDAYVLPAINDVARKIAQGASDVGTFSHGPAYLFTAHGKQWKFPSAYGAMNQCSITCALALELSTKCGVKDDEVNRVIRKAAYFYRWFADKGAIPYGDHAPFMQHDNNGVNSQAAVLFDLLGDKETADYYTRETLASYKVREMGHTGHFFSFQWGALGAARGGDQAAQSFVRNMQWSTELERRPNGGFMYQPQLANLDHGKYVAWSTTGSRLLQYCLPRKQLYITGKGGSCIAPITGEELKKVVAAGVFDPAKLTVRALLEALGNGSPIVRFKAAEALGTRDENVVKELIALLDSPNRYARYGACEGLRYAGRGSESAVAALLDKLGNSKDMTLRYYAVLSFEKRGEPSLTSSAHANWKRSLASGEAIDKAVPALLKQAAIYEPHMDPLRKLHNVIADILFGKEGLLKNGSGVEKVDRRVLIPAIKSLLINPNGNARTRVSSVFPRLTGEDLKQLWGDIYYATKYQAPSGSMMAPGVRLQGLKLMSDKGIEEGIPVGINYILRQEGWGESDRTKNGRPALLAYGKALENFVPEIDDVLSTRWHKDKIIDGTQVGSTMSKYTQEDAKEFKKRLAEALKKPAPKLESIKPYIDATPDPLEPTKKKRDYEIAVTRETPAEWKKLVPGGQFMDRILPAPIYKALTTNTWGAAGVRPRDIQNGIEDPAWSYWGGKAVLGPDGQYHWFGCRWPEGNPKGHNGWPHSEIIHAVGDRPTGPFVFKDRIGPGHFPEITQLRDGSWRLYHFTGYYQSKTLDGPWTPVTREEDGFPGIQMGSVCLREDGSLLMVDRGSRIWVKENGSDRFVRQSEEVMVPKHMYGWYEDPFIWRTEVQYHMLVNDWQGRLAYHMRSADGIHWKTDPGLAYTLGIDRYEDGTKVNWFKYERPKVMQDAYGRPTHIYFAVIDVPKDDDKPSDMHSSKNIALPLVVERRLRVLNSEPINEKTAEIRVRILAEQGFDPQKDLNLESLRFGATEEVDYGRGAVLTGTKPDGADLILIFNDKGNGLLPDEFAGKLLGKTSAGGLLIGWAKLPK